MNFTKEQREWLEKRGESLADASEFRLWMLFCWQVVTIHVFDNLVMTVIGFIGFVAGMIWISKTRKKLVRHTLRIPNNRDLFEAEVKAEKKLQRKEKKEARKNGRSSRTGS